VSKRNKRPQYLPGATWEDVLAGVPVTADEQRKTTAPEMMKARCRSCGRVRTARFGTGVTPTCGRCGGVMRPPADD
jgi:hypothetical protein